MADLFLLIGNKKYSSWSLRPWLVLKQAGLAFDEQQVPLDRPDTRANILKFSPSGKVPFLRHGKIEVWESLAICEYLAEAFPAAGLWPKDVAARAQARAVSSEMHAGFGELRRYLPMDVSQDLKGESRAHHVAGDIARVQQIWADCRQRFGKQGPFLFGRFSVADGMFAPVVTRFWTYGVKLMPVAAAYVDTIMKLPAMKEWVEAARHEPWIIVYPDPTKAQMSADDPAAGHGETAPLACRRFKNPMIAYGTAVDLLRPHKPFSQVPFGAYASMLRGQIAREHYVFAVQDKLVVGYVGWALCSDAVARAWTERRHSPKYEECLSGDCWVGLTYFATSRHVTFAMMGHIKRRYPGYKIYGLRRYQDGRDRFLHTGPRPAGQNPIGG